MLPHMQEWVHVIATTRGQWLPGDARGFRNRRHRVHSSGDYRHPPPPQEHAGLRQRSGSIAAEPVVLLSQQRERVGLAVAEKLARMDFDVAALCCSATHCHALVRVGQSDAIAIFGRAKQYASHHVRHDIPGKLWGASSHVVRVRSEEQFQAVRQYILDHALEGAWIWECETQDQ